MFVIQSETVCLSVAGFLLPREPMNWSAGQPDIWHCCTPRRGWTERGRSGWHELHAGALRLCITDQRDRNCGWVWHATVDCRHAEGGDIAAKGGFATEEEAQADAVRFARSFCQYVLDALPAETA